MISMTPYRLAERFIGIKETPGVHSTPLILAMLQLDAGSAVQDDAVAWCSAFLNFVFWLLRLPRSKSLAARSWLKLGSVIRLSEAIEGFDVVILSRGEGKQPGPDVLDAPGHVGLFSRYDPNTHFVYLLAGNQGNEVSVLPFPAERVLGVRRITPLAV